VDEQELSEADIQTMILDHLNRSGVFAFRVNSAGIYDSRSGVYRRPSKYFMKGCSDVLGCLPDGRMLAIECKAIKGRLSMEQSAFISKIQAQGGLAMVARSVEDVKEQLQGEGYGLDKFNRYTSTRRGQETGLAQ